MLTRSCNSFKVCYYSSLTWPRTSPSGTFFDLTLVIGIADKRRGGATPWWGRGKTSYFSREWPIMATHVKGVLVLSRERNYFKLWEFRGVWRANIWEAGNKLCPPHVSGWRQFLNQSPDFGKTDLLQQHNQLSLKLKTLINPKFGIFLLSQY